MPWEPRAASRGGAGHPGPGETEKRPFRRTASLSGKSEHWCPRQRDDPPGWQCQPLAGAWPIASPVLCLLGEVPAEGQWAHLPARMPTQATPPDKGMAGTGAYREYPCQERVTHLASSRPSRSHSGDPPNPPHSSPLLGSQDPPLAPSRARSELPSESPGSQQRRAQRGSDYQLCGSGPVTPPL